jgi:hypothetical protein
MSQVPDDLLMWAHYANCHAGICLGFYAGPSDFFFRCSQEVSYADEYPQFKMFNDADTRMQASILTKSRDWAYEKEYRLFNVHEGPGVRRYPPELLAEVILGCRILAEDKKDVLRWARNHPAQPKIFEAGTAQRKFALKLNELTFPSA